MEQNLYKTYQRDHRIQSSDESFKEGQVFTRAPLAEGRTRVLNNYDIIYDGEAITNRKGIRTSLVGLPITDLLPTIHENLSLTQGLDAVTEDDNKYRLLIANQMGPNDQPIPNINLTAGKAELWAMHTGEGVTEYPFLDEYDIPTHSFYAIPLSYQEPLPYDTTTQWKVGDTCIYNNQAYKCTADTSGAWDASKWTAYTYPKSYYHTPDSPEAHGIKLTHKEYLGRPVGTFAFGHDYYSFNTDGELIRAKYKPAEGGVQATFISEKLKPKSLTASEAMTLGFNMLSTEPFVFSDKYEQGSITLQGLNIYNDNTLIMEPLLNTPYKVRCFYSAQQNDTYKFVWDYREVEGDTWTKIEEKEYTLSAATPPEVSILKFSAPIESMVLRVRAYKKENNAYPDDPTKEISVGINYSRSASSTTANRELKNYDLSKVTGMTYWKGRLWLYGLAQDPTVLFYSDVNEPTYFPYPQCINIFDEPILHVLPFNDTLLVFTKSQMHQVTYTDQNTFNYKVLQGNLNFTDFDVRFIQVVKNMVFFKSGDYYYMIVPKSLSLKNEYALAPVSKNIDYFLDDFMENVKTLFQNVYEYEDELELVNHYNYLNYEDVYNVYTFQTNLGLLLNLVLLYNTVDRTWRMYTYESQTMYYPFRQDATKSGELMSPIYPKFVANNTETNGVGVQFLEAHRTEVKDFYIPTDSRFVTSGGVAQPDNGVIEAAFETLHVFKNYQMLDTGYRDHALDYNKRFRELQIKFNNAGTSRIQFYTEFILDGDTRVSRFKYETEHIIDPSSPNYGLIYISRTPVENLELPGTTLLAEDAADINAWTLDSSRFPEVAYWKARLKVSGKGYTPRIRLICRTEERYELLGYTWVYRQMYSR